MLLTIDGVENDIIVLHHFTQIGGSVRMKETKIVALNGFGPLSSVVRFNDADVAFGHIETREVPTPKSLEDFTDAESFEKLASDG